VCIVTAVALAINGSEVRADIEPRLNLADFLREHQFLTGTHVGCEHGVCGACTVLIDGSPARSCITYAVACDGAEVTTLEGLKDDPVMGVLRDTFSEHHALQCGFCTPGMLMTARDIVMRLPQADEKRIRLELSGNLCRCTGYVGIVAAVRSALTKAAADVEPRRRLGPVGSHPPVRPREPSRAARATRGASTDQPPAVAVVGLDAVDWTVVERDGVELHQAFSVPFPRQEVWNFFCNLDRVIQCMPGARLTGLHRGDHAEGEVNVKLGPIVSAFHGVLDVARSERDFRGVVRAAGRDAKSPSSARAVMSYEVNALDEVSSRVDVTTRFMLSGALAQFSRSGLVKDIADHLTSVFARNLEARLRGETGDAGSGDTLDAGAIARSTFWRRLRAFVRRLWGR
jgi:aerobic carbon-monoxide dehydrogenase small subunit